MLEREKTQEISVFPGKLCWGEGEQGGKDA